MGIDSSLAQRDPAEEEERIAAWLTDEMGCTDIDIQRMRRWRPILQADVTRAGKRVRLFLKGERTWPTHPYPLSYERDMQQALSDNGIKVPEILGWVADPSTIVMEWVDGGRDAGLIQEAIESGSSMSEDRWQASLEYMDVLAELHAIPVEHFVKAGADFPADNAELMLGNFERFHAMSTRVGITDPFVAFISGWLRRNCPQNRAGMAFLTGDCGQFLADGSQITCLMDFEIGHIGDPMRDLACFRGRHPIENMGDIIALFRQYAATAGTLLDWPGMAFHTVAFLAEAYYGPLIGLHDAGPGGDWAESHIQVAVIGRRSLEALAELKGIELDKVELPAAEQTPLEDLALNRLDAEIGRLPEHPQLQVWQRNIMATIPQLLRQIGHYRSWRDAAYLADIAALTGRAVAGVAQGDEALLEFLQSAGSDKDADIVRLLHRKLLRDCLIIAGENPAPNHIALAPIEPVLHLATDDLDG